MKTNIRVDQGLVHLKNPTLKKKKIRICTPYTKINTVSR